MIDLYLMFKSVILVDDFTKRLWNICEIVQREGIAQVFKCNKPF